MLRGFKTVCCVRAFLQSALYIFSYGSITQVTFAGAKSMEQQRHRTLAYNILVALSISNVAPSPRLRKRAGLRGCSTRWKGKQQQRDRRRRRGRRRRQRRVPARCQTRRHIDLPPSRHNSRLHLPQPPPSSFALKTIHCSAAVKSAAVVDEGCGGHLPVDATNALSVATTNERCR